MFKFNRKIEYALMALKHMNSLRPGQLATAKEVSLVYKCPYEVTSKVLQVMTGNGLLRSEKGAHGGYQLVKDLSKITILELTEMFVGHVHLAECLEIDHGHCELAGTCNVISPMVVLNQKLIQFMETITVLECISFQTQEENVIRLDYERRASL